MQISILELEELDNLEIVVCSNGEIFTLPKRNIRANGRIDNRKGVKLKQVKDKYGYYKITLSFNHKRKTYFVHRLVAKAFIPNYKENLQVNHKNGIKADNNVENIEMVTLQENIRHSIESGLKPKMIRGKNGRFLRKEVMSNE